MSLCSKLLVTTYAASGALLRGFFKASAVTIREGCYAIQLMLLSLLFVLLASAAQAHEITPAVVNILVNNDRTINVNILTNLESLIAGIGTDHDDTEDSANSQHYTLLRSKSPSELKEEFEKFKPSFLANISIKNGSDQPLELSGLNLKIPEVGNTDIKRDSIIEIIVEANLSDKELYWQWDEQYGETILRADSYNGELNYAALLAPGQRSLSIPVDGGNEDQALLQVVKNYIVVGFTHILPKGLDHVLFIIALFLVSPYWKPLLIQATTFTVAHSITLFLGVTKVVNVPGSIVEPLIALSIVALCIENIFYRSLSKKRVLLVFVFGLLHGLGFASILGEVGLGSKNYLIALLSFNIGVELGQLLVILICMLAVGIWFRHKPWYHARVTSPASLIIGLIGLYWVFERVI